MKQSCKNAQEFWKLVTILSAIKYDLEGVFQTEANQHAVCCMHGSVDCYMN